MTEASPSDPAARPSNRPRWARSGVLLPVLVGVVVVALVVAAIVASGEDDGGSGSSGGAGTDGSSSVPAAEAPGGTPAPAPGGGEASGAAPPGTGGPFPGGESVEQYEAVLPAYPIPEAPASGCRGGSVTVTLGASPDPLCVALGGGDTLGFRNATDAELVVVLGSFQETIAPGDTASLGAVAADLGPGRHYFWAPGLPQLSGIIDVS